MRVPHIINENTKITYTPSPETLNLLGESLRKLISENFEWDKNQCPTLEDLCVQEIAKHFKDKHPDKELPCADKDYLLEVLAVDLPLEIIIPLIFDEFYWQRRYKEIFGLVTRPKPKDWTWKGLYLERHVQQLVEKAEPQYGDEDTFEEILELCQPYVKRLYVTQLQPWKPPLTMEKEDIPEEWPIDHINFFPIFKKLSNIEEFDLVFGVNDVGEDFKWNMFKITVADCQRLGKALFELKELRIIRIHRSKLEYEHCRSLMQSLVRHKTFEELDLSNCEIGDAGALCIAYFLQDGTNLKVLNLANNQIGKIGCEAIGFAMLSGNCEYLTVLNLRMNPLKTEGAMGIMRAMVRCAIPKKLSMSACLFEEDTPLKVCQMLQLNESLKKLDISCNWFGEQGGEELVTAVSANTTLEWLDARDTDIKPEQQEKINEFLLRNRKIGLELSRKEELFEDQEKFLFVYE